MAMIYCKECGKEISDKAEKCPHCGFPMNPPIQNNYQTATQNNQKIKNSGLGVASLILSILGCTLDRKSVV